MFYTHADEYVHAWVNVKQMCMYVCMYLLLLLLTNTQQVSVLPVQLTHQYRKPHISSLSWAAAEAQLVGYLPGIHEALGSIPRTV